MPRKKPCIKQHLSPELLDSYRKQELSFKELATACHAGTGYLTKYFREEGLKTNRDLKKDSIYHNVFSSLDNEFSIYLLGLFTADGSIGTYTRNNNICRMFKLSATESDSSHLKKNT